MGAQEGAKETLCFCIFHFVTTTSLWKRRDSGFVGKNQSNFFLPDLTWLVLVAKIEPVQLKFTKLRSGDFVVCGY